jgi:hypothetical protein
MVQAVPQTMTFADFLAWKPETGRYELHNGVVVDRQPTGPHVREASPPEKQVVGLLNRKLNVLIDQEDWAYFTQHLSSSDVAKLSNNAPTGLPSP